MSWMRATPLNLEMVQQVGLHYLQPQVRTQEVEIKLHLAQAAVARGAVAVWRMFAIRPAQNTRRV